MSKDIRCFFTQKKAPKPKIEDDEDIIPDSPDVQIKNKKKESRKKRVLSDSDDEIFSSKKKRTDAKTSPAEKSNTKGKAKTPQKKLQEVKVESLFGREPVKRTAPIVKKDKKKTETGIHSDDEFEKSLLDIDEDIDKKVDGNNDKNVEIKSPAKSAKETKQLVKNITNNHKSPTKIKTEAKTVEESPSKGHRRKKDMRKEFNEFLEPESHSITIKKEEKKDTITHESSSNGMGSPKETNKSRKRELDKTIEDHEEDVFKKKKLNKSLNESVLTDEERFERKRHSAALYQSYLNRSGPKHLGSKEIPEGAPDCLRDCAFLLTGVLDSFEKDDVAAAITKYGGSVKSGVSKKVTHVLAGEDAGPAKMARAQELGIKIINEDEFLAMIAESKKDKSIKKEIKKERSPRDKNKRIEKDKNESNKESRSKETTKHSDSKNKTTPSKRTDKSPKNQVDKPIQERKTEIIEVKNENKSRNEDDTNSIRSTVSTSGCPDTPPALMWVDKYKPQNLKQIIGQHGEKSNVNKLSGWLSKWYANRKAKVPRPSPWAKNDDGAYYRAALLSGPPGVGKTTTVSLVCKELGFDVVELNASDSRSKTLLRDQLGDMLSTTSLSGYAKGNTGKQAVTKKHVLVMDEVDGMAGNEDRGGLQELINLIKTTSVPIVCMCNDRNSQKMRSLVNYCYDLRFSRPALNQIRAALMSICFKEGVKIPAEALSQLIAASNNDVRQSLHRLSLWAAAVGVGDQPANADSLARDANAGKKDLKLGPWEAVRKVFSAEEHKTMSIHDKSDLFFSDYSLAPLFVQENYLQVSPHCPKHEVLERVSRAADSISLGDLVDARIRGSQAWSLLPTQAMFSSVIPGHMMAGHVAGQIQFPGWLGKNSRRSKMQRLAQEIHAHTRLSTTGSKSSILLDYSSHLRDAIVTPLVQQRGEGVADCLAVLQAYHLAREDLDSLVELSLWPGQRNPTVLIDPKVKAAMTRAYNKQSSALPYAPQSARAARAKHSDDDGYGEDSQEQDDEPDDSDPENDALIKKKTKPKEEKASSSKEKPSTSKGKGKKK